MSQEKVLPRICGLFCVLNIPQWNELKWLGEPWDVPQQHKPGIITPIVRRLSPSCGSSFALAVFTALSDLSQSLFPWPFSLSYIEPGESEAGHQREGWSNQAAPTLEDAPHFQLPHGPSGMLPLLNSSARILPLDLSRRKAKEVTDRDCILLAPGFLIAVALDITVIPWCCLFAYCIKKPSDSWRRTIAEGAA